MDVGCYCVNLMRFITAEEPAAIVAKGIIGETTGVDEALSGILEFPSGIIGHFDLRPCARIASIPTRSKAPKA